MCLPSANLPRRSGNLNVPTPLSAAEPLYVVPIMSNNSGNLDLSTSPPSQNKNPVGGCVPAYGRIPPNGIPKSPTNVSRVSLRSPVSPPASAEALYTST